MRTGSLVAEGWLTARQGSGTVVANRAAVPSTPAVVLPQERSYRYDLTPGSPDVATFPRTDWLAASRKALTLAPNEAFGMGDPRGRIELRRELADYLARARGVRADPERILICSGYVQALSLLSEAIKNLGGTTIAVEEFGYGLHRDVIRARGLSVVAVPVDELGAQTSRLAGQGVLLTPAHQMPTACRSRRSVVPLPSNGRGSRGRCSIEDDYDGEFRYDRQSVGALQALDPERVVYTGTASKSLAPGLRLAWMVLPQRLIEPVIAAKRTADYQTATLGATGPRGIHCLRPL